MALMEVLNQQKNKSNAKKKEQTWGKVDSKGNLYANGTEFMICIPVDKIFYTGYMRLHGRTCDISSSYNFVDLKDGVCEKLDHMQVFTVVHNNQYTVDNFKNSCIRDFFCYNKIDMLDGRVKYRRKVGSWFTQHIEVNGSKHTFRVVGLEQWNSPITGKEGIYIDGKRVAKSNKEQIKYMRLSFMHVEGNFLICEFSLFSHWTGMGSGIDEFDNALIDISSYWEDANRYFDMHTEDFVDDYYGIKPYKDGLVERPKNDCDCFGCDEAENYPVVVTFDLNTGVLFDVSIGSGVLEGRTLGKS